MNPQKIKSVCFTGHRNFPLEQSGKLLLAVELLILQGYTEFYAGGAIGFDTCAAQAVLYLRQQYPQIKLHLLLPCDREEQTRGWSQMQLQLYDYIRSQADETVILGHYDRACMLRRNQALVDAASFCLCWFNQQRQRSGTGQTIRLAQKQRLQIQNLFVTK